VVGTIETPDEFDRMAASEIERLSDGDACCAAASLRDSLAPPTSRQNSMFRPTWDIRCPAGYLA